MAKENNNKDDSPKKNTNNGNFIFISFRLKLDNFVKFWIYIDKAEKSNVLSDFKLTLFTNSILISIIAYLFLQTRVEKSKYDSNLFFLYH